MITALICWLLGKLGKVSRKGGLFIVGMITRFLGSFISRTTVSPQDRDICIPSLCHFRWNDNIQQSVSSTCDCFLLPGGSVTDDCIQRDSLVGHCVWDES